MTTRDLRQLVDTSVRAWVDDYASSMGAAIAYYTLFSIAPLLIVVGGVAGLVYGQDAAEGQIVAQLQGSIGPDAASLVQSLLRGMSRPAEGALATVFGTITLFVGATSVFGELQSALNRIWRAPDVSRRLSVLNLVRTRLLSFAMVLILGLLLVVSLTFSAALSYISHLSPRVFAGWDTVLQGVNFATSFILNTAIFAMIYKIMPRARIAWRDVGIGAAVTALLFEVSKLLIALYLGRTRVASSFGAAGSLVLFLVWVYLSAQIFLLGAEFTWAYAHQRGSRSGRRTGKATAGTPSRAGDATDEEKARVAFASDSGVDLEVRHDGQMVARDTREVEPAAMSGAEGERAAVVDAVEGPLREEGREGEEGASRRGVGR